MSRHGNSRYDDRRRSVDVTFEERERDVYRERDRYREFDFDENFETYRDARTSGALVPIHQERVIERELVQVPQAVREERFVEVERIEKEPIIEVELEKIEKKITEHEHEHHHRHIVIDHGTTYINAAPPPPPPPANPAPLKPRTEVREKEITRVTLEGVRERRYGTNYRGSGTIDVVEKDIKIEEKPRERQRSTSRHVEYRRYRNYEDDYGINPRNSTGMIPDLTLRNDWTVVDVPAETRREEIDVTVRSNNIRRTAGRDRKGDLWTEITKDLITREALEEFGYAYEEAEEHIYVFEYLSRDQIQELIELSKDIRRERVRRIERDVRGRVGGGYETDRVSERREFTPYGERDTYRERRDIYYS